VFERRLAHRQPVDAHAREQARRHLQGLRAGEPPWRLPQTQQNGRHRSSGTGLELEVVPGEAGGLALRLGQLEQSASAVLNLAVDAGVGGWRFGSGERPLINGRTVFARLLAEAAKGEYPAHCRGQGRECERCWHYETHQRGTCSTPHGAWVPLRPLPPSLEQSPLAVDRALGKARPLSLFLGTASDWACFARPCISPCIPCLGSASQCQRVTTARKLLLLLLRLTSETS